MFVACHWVKNGRAAIVERDQRQDEFRVAKLLMEREIAQIQSGGSFSSQPPIFVSDDPGRVAWLLENAGAKGAP
jgi:hypothetical protein